MAHPSSTRPNISRKRSGRTMATSARVCPARDGGDRSASEIVRLVPHRGRHPEPDRAVVAEEVGDDRREERKFCSTVTRIVSRGPPLPVTPVEAL
jgi:hypothetical protein